jgi:leucyl-tRNA synthetase
MAPSTPYVAEELWGQLGESYSVHTQAWPTYDETLAQDDYVEMVIQINGKLRDRVVLPANASEETARATVRQAERVAAALTGVEIVKEIYVPGRLMNFVVRPR